MAGFMKFLYQHIPHRWINPKTEGTNKLFLGLGSALDYTQQYIDMLKNNNSTRTAFEIIADLENEYGLEVNPSYDVNFRRELIIAKKRMQDSPITLPDLLGIFDALGFKIVKVENNFNASTMGIYIEAEFGFIEVVSEIRKILEQSIRAHILYGIIQYDLSQYFVYIQIDTTLTLLSEFEPRLTPERLYLNGTWLLDGTYWLNGYKTDYVVEYYPSKLSTKASFDVLTNTFLRYFYYSKFEVDIKEVTTVKLLSEFNSRLDYEKLYLNGDCLLDGTYWLNGYKSTVWVDYYPSSVEINNGINCNINCDKSKLTVEKDLWFLNGDVMLDGSRLLDAEIIEYIL